MQKLNQTSIYNKSILKHNFFNCWLGHKKILMMILYIKFL